MVYSYWKEIMQLHLESLPKGKWDGIENGVPHLRVEFRL